MSNAVVYSIGVCCPIGSSFVATRAAYLTNKRAFEKEAALVGPDGGPPTLATVIPFTECRDYQQRIVELLATALHDCLARVPSALLPVPLCVIVDAWMEDHPLREGFAAEVMARFSNALDGIDLRFGGSPEALLLLGKEAKAIQDGDRQRIVASVSSFIHPALLDRLQLEKRVFHHGNPYGLIPGECACAFFLSNDEASGELPRPLGSILAVFKSVEPNAEDDCAFSGGALAANLGAATQLARPDRLLMDLNGERWRAEEAGFAVARVSTSLVHLASDIETPALNVGDCGTAMGQLLAAFSFLDYKSEAASRISLVSTASVTGMRAAAVLERLVHER